MFCILLKTWRSLLESGFDCLNFECSSSRKRARRYCLRGSRKANLRHPFQWYAKFHPDDGPLRYANAEALEAGLGDRLRDVYAGLKDVALQTALGAARKVVEVSYRTCRSRCEKCGPRTVKKRPASNVLKRPAAKRSSSSSSAPSSLVRIVGTQALEETVGDRCRREVSDHVLGLGRAHFKVS